MASVRCISALCAVLLMAACVHGGILRSRGDVKQTTERKMRNGPPSGFAGFAIPSPTTGAVFNSDATYYVALNAQQGANGGWAYERQIALDTATSFTLAVVLLDGAEPQGLTMTAPDGTLLDLASAASEGYWPLGDSGPLSSQPVQTFYTFENLAAGLYTLSFSSDAMLTGSHKDGIIYTWVNSEDEIYSHLSSYENTMRLDDTLGVVARMYDVSTTSRASLRQGVVPKAMPDIVSMAELIVTMPDLSLQVIQMHDDGLHSDGQADDGIFGGHIVTDTVGSYLLQSTLAGKHADGTPFYRTAEHLVEVVPHDLDLTGKAEARVELAHSRVVFEIGVTEDASNAYEGTYIAYAQVWGKHFLSGKDVAVAWAQARVDPAPAANGATIVSLDVDARWLLKAAAVGPFTLKDVQIHEAHTLDLVAQADVLSVGHSREVGAALNGTLASLRATGYTGDVTEAMLMGPRPASFVARMANASAANGDHKLVLVHGYCTERNPFLDAYDWTDGIFFLDAKASRSNDEFVNLLMAFIQGAGGNPSSYSMVGHSQGGMAQLHAYHFYWSGIDTKDSGRKIQSLATPYQGCSGLAALNAVGPLIGGCGDNTDLGRDGATNWLSQISAESRKEMYYYTTEGSPKQCSGLTNMFIKKPNDGVTEVVFASLDGGNFMGHTLGECHGHNMKYPASFLNADRNKEMNDASARP